MYTRYALLTRRKLFATHALRLMPHRPANLPAVIQRRAPTGAPPWNLRSRAKWERRGCTYATSWSGVQGE